LDASSAVETRDLTYVIGRRTVLDGVDLTVRHGHSLAVVGPSGTGKTTLLMCLAGLITPTRGNVLIGGRDLTTMTTRERARIRLRSVGLIYQFGELLPELSPLDNVALPALLGGAAKGEAYRRSRQLLADLGISAVAEADTAVLSGGERQRVAVARALISRPSIILADEPTGSLDRNAADSVAAILFGLPKERDCSLIVVTHNEEVAARADSILALGLRTDWSGEP
jgi:ABC-type lipoprotein export system ATPase subunit